MNIAFPLIHLTKKRRKNILFSFFILFVFTSLLILLYVLIAADSMAKQQSSSTHLYSLDISLPSPAPYPVLSSISQPDISAQSAIIIDNDAKVVIFAKNPMLQTPMASSTKIMTALVGLDYYTPQQVLTDKTFPVDGSIAGLTLGEKMTFANALYGLLLPSGNDVAVMMAQNYPFGMSAFIDKMNEKARALQMEHTFYADVDGLNSANVTTAQDMATLASYALKNPTFVSVVGTKNLTISDLTGGQKHTLSNLNKLLGKEGVTGIKTGFTDEAGGVLITSKLEKGHTFIIVVLKSEDRFLDTEKLLQLVNNNISFVLPR